MATSFDDDAAMALFEALALQAGGAVMEVFAGTSVQVDTKADLSPVTEADRASERIILEALRAALPSIPVVSEEEFGAGIGPRAPGEVFILVDPLDGTREFVAGDADFTVNIALVRHGRPELGVVYAPCSGRLYSGRLGRAEMAALSETGKAVMSRRPIAVRPRQTPIRIVASRSHRTAETDGFIRRFRAAELLSVGSSLKFCMIAAGQADLYPRFGRTMQWDTAAGDAILRAAGGITVGLDGRPLKYGADLAASPSAFENPSFVAAGSLQALDELLGG